MGTVLFIGHNTFPRLTGFVMDKTSTKNIEANNKCTHLPGLMYTPRLWKS